MCTRKTVLLLWWFKNWHLLHMTMIIMLLLNDLRLNTLLVLLWLIITTFMVWIWLTCISKAYLLDEAMLDRYSLLMEWANGWCLLGPASCISITISNRFYKKLITDFTSKFLKVFARKEFSLLRLIKEIKNRGVWIRTEMNYFTRLFILKKHADVHITKDRKLNGLLEYTSFTFGLGNTSEFWILNVLNFAFWWWLVTHLF